MPEQHTILRANCKTHLITTTPLKDHETLWGGRKLTCELINQEVPPTCDPLGRHNKLVFAAGALAGSLASSANRISAGAKSPLTGGIKESNGGGMPAYCMGRLTIRAIVLEDCPEKNAPWHVVYVSANGARFDKADHLAGMGVYAKASALFEQYGSHVALSLIGPAGEMLLHTAGIANTDPEGEPSRYCGRGGLGAVMGSKGIHAIVYDAAAAPKQDYADREAFTALTKQMAQTINNNTTTAVTFRKYGTANTVDFTQALAGLPTRNFSAGRFEFADAINGKSLHDTIVARGGEGRAAHACMRGCLIQCSNIYPDLQGKKLCSPIEYENISLLGSNLNINNLDDIAQLNHLCNDLGCDTIETGAALGVAMEMGVLPFGDAQAAAGVLEEMRQGTALGRVIGSGAGVTGTVFGCRRIPTVKNQAMAAYDPRSIKGIGVTYATSAQGADHTAGQTLSFPLDHAHKEGQVKASRQAQITHMVFDSLGCCGMLRSMFVGFSLFCDLLQAKTGMQITPETLVEEAENTLRQEREFNIRAGISSAHDRLPEYMYEETHPEANTVFDLSPEELRNALDY